MNEDIIRITKEHEVVMPEGSINAVSKSGMLNMTSMEPEHRETIVQENMVTNRRISIDDDGPDHATPALVPAQAPQSNTNAVMAVDPAHGQSVALATERAPDQNQTLVTPVESEIADPVLGTSDDVVEQLDQAPVTEPEGVFAPIHDINPEAVIDPHAQVVASLADKWNEEYEGRVVKLREEVDHLNQRLDRLEK